MFARGVVRGYSDPVSDKVTSKRDSAQAVETREELEALLLEGLDSGEPRPVSEADWESLRKRALLGSEIRKSG